MAQPPKFFRNFFRWFCHPRLHKPIEGDLMELYYERVDESGKKKADLLFVKDVMALFRKDIIRPISGTYRLNSYGLIKSHFITSFKQLFQPKSLSILKVIGLIIGFGCFLLIQSFVGFHQSFDRFHQEADHIHRVNYLLKHEGATIKHAATTPPTIAPYLTTHVPGIKDYVRILHFPNMVFQFRSSVFREDKVFIADPSFFEVFDFTLTEGNASYALADRGSLVISQRISKKYFGDEPAVGQRISIDGYEDYVITGVFEDPPPNSHLDFELILSFETARYWFEGETETDWTSGEYHSYILFEDHVNIKQIKATLASINEQSPQGEWDNARNVERIYGITPLVDIHLNSHLAEEIDVATKGNLAFIQILNIISFVILAISLFNYISQSSIRLLVRSKELGIRKVLGASHGDLFAQFLIESLLIQLISLGATIAGIVAISSILSTDHPLYISPDWFKLQETWFRLFIFFSSVFSITSLLPILFIASLDFNQAIKGKLKSGLKAHQLRKTTAAIQLLASSIFITAAFIVYLQLDHIQLQDPGINLEKTLLVKGPTTDDSGLDIFLEEIQKKANIIQVGAGEFLPGLAAFSSAPVTRTDQQELSYHRIKSMYINEGYLTVLNAKFIAGRNFNPTLQTDTSAVIINRSALKTLQYQSANEAINSIIQWGSGYQSRIAGVIEDYQQASAKHPSFPMIFWFYPAETTHLLIRYTGNDQLIQEQVAAVFQGAFPADPFDYQFLDQHYARQFQEDKHFGKAFFLFTLISVLLACNGLFTLIYQNSIRRTKEIGIRKVFGAPLHQVIKLLSGELIYLTIITLIVAFPITYWIMTNWLSNYALRIELSPMIFILSGILVISLVICTGGYHTFRAAIANPINSLRDE